MGGEAGFSLAKRPKTLGSNGGCFCWNTRGGPQRKSFGIAVILSGIQIVLQNVPSISLHQ
jgi:hypothetical protein